MKFFIDTFSWKKIDILQASELFDMAPVYDTVKICITHSVLSEINHFRLKSCLVEKVEVLPHQDNRIYKDALTLDFDEADASILSHSFDETDTYIISEDRPFLTYGKSFGIKIIQLVDFMEVLTSLNIVSKNDLYQINRELRKIKNISEKKEKSIKNWLKTFNG